MLLGHNKQTQLKFSIDSESSKIKFNSGMNFWCNTPIGVRFLKVVQMNEKSADEIEIEVGCRVGVGFASIFRTQSDTHPKIRFSKVWKEANLLNEEEGYKEFLANKVSSECL